MNQITYQPQTALRVNKFAVNTSAFDELAEVVSSLLGITCVSIFIADRGEFKLAGEYGNILIGDLSPECWLRDFLHVLPVAQNEDAPIFMACNALHQGLSKSINPRINVVGVVRFSDYADFLVCLLLGSEQADAENLSRDLENYLSLGGNLSKLLSRMNHLHAYQDHLIQMQTLSRLEIAVNSSTNLETSLDLLLNQGRSIFGYNAALLSIFNPTTLQLEYTYGSKLSFVDNSPRTARIGDGLAGRAALERRLMGGKIDNVAELPQFMQELIQQEQVKYHYAVPVESKGSLKGVLEIFSREQTEPVDRWQMLMDVFVSKLGSVIYDAEVIRLNQRLSIELENAYDSICMTWVQEIETYLGEPLGHTCRMAELSVQIGRKFGLSREDLTNTYRGALLHDIGMLRIPTQVVQTRETIDHHARRMIQMHPLYAHDQLGKIDRLKPALDIPLYHHERWDGSGYPFHFKGEQIPLSARIFAVVDVWDAMRSNRLYRKPMHENSIKNYLRQFAGVLFDPIVVSQFLTIV